MGSKLATAESNSFAKMYPPVLEAIKDLLVTVNKNPFGSDIHRCLGNVQDLKNGEAVRQCSKNASNREGRNTANDLMKTTFTKMDEVPHDDEFYEKVRAFIQLIHCTPRKNLKGKPHSAAALAKFEAWKQERTVAHLHASVNLETPATDESPTHVKVGTDEPLSQPYPVTPPRKPSGRKLDAYEQDSAPASPSNTALSPGAESVFDDDYGVASPAGTAITTPGSLPVPPGDSPSTIAPEAYDFGDTVDDSDDYDELKPYYTDDSLEESDFEDADDRPETPAPLPRNRSIPNMPFAEVGPLGIVTRGRKATLVQKRHDRLLNAITSSFNKTECLHGRVYVWTHKTEPGLVKIGFTKRTIQARRKDKNCYAKDTYEFWESKEAFVGAYRVEKIMKHHLREWHVPLTICRHCPKGHTEWFRKDAVEVRALMEDWTNFTRVAYQSGMLTEAGRRAVRARILDMQPNVAELVAHLVSKAANETIFAVGALASISEQGDAVTGDVDVPVNILVGDERITITAEPDSWSLRSEDAVSPRTIPRERAAGPAKSKWRDIPWKDKAKATCRLFGGHKSARPEDSASLSGEGSSQRRDVGEGRYDEMKQSLNSLARRVMKLEEETENNKHEDDLAVRRRIISWIPRPRRAATISIIANSSLS